MSLEHVFDAQLQHLPGAEPIASADGRQGTLIGSGDGTASGRKVNGKISWTLYEETAGARMCTMDPAIVIESPGGAKLRFDGRGYATRPTDDARVWNVAATLHFESDDPEFTWLDGAIGYWEGEFDQTTGTARYRAYAPSTDGNGRDEGPGDEGD